MSSSREKTQVKTIVMTAFFAAIRQGEPIPAWFDRDFKGNLPGTPRRAHFLHTAHQH